MISLFYKSKVAMTRLLAMNKISSALLLIASNVSLRIDRRQLIAI